MGEQADDVPGFLDQLAESDFRSTPGEFKQVRVSLASWHIRDLADAISTDAGQACTYLLNQPIVRCQARSAAALL
jgi:hypothetical protein